MSTIKERIKNNELTEKDKVVLECMMSAIDVSNGDAEITTEGTIIKMIGGSQGNTRLADTGEKIAEFKKQLNEAFVAEDAAKWKKNAAAFRKYLTAQRSYYANLKDPTSTKIIEFIPYGIIKAFSAKESNAKINGVDVTDRVKMTDSLRKLTTIEAIDFQIEFLDNSISEADEFFGK